jgi:hypothetical protein
MKNFEKDSDSKKPGMKKNGHKQVNTGKGKALKGIPESLLEAPAKSIECKWCCSIEH